MNEKIRKRIIYALIFICLLIIIVNGVLNINAQEEKKEYYPIKEGTLELTKLRESFINDQINREEFEKRYSEITGRLPLIAYSEEIPQNTIP